MAEKVLLKKYANRRLYNTEKSAYVTLNQVADMIREGREVEVIDAKTEEDVTPFILTQIILEEARKKNALLPVPLLHMIIQYGENVLQEFFEKYLEQTIQNYLAYKGAVDGQFKKWLDMSMRLSDMARKTMPGITPFKPFFDQSPDSADKRDKDKKEE